MLVFTIPLISRSAAKNWQRVSELCRRTIRSCCAQKLKDFHVVLVGNEPPAGLEGMENLTIITESFPIPSTHSEKMQDKRRKLQRALIHLRDRAPFDWCKADPDDLLSNRLCDYIRSHDIGAGVYFPRGYIYTEGDRHLFLERRNFDRICGTSSILRINYADELPRSMDQKPEEFEFLGRSHSDLRSLMRMGQHLNSLPFPGAIYCTGHGQNDSGFGGVKDFSSVRWLLRRLVNYRPLTNGISRQYGLVPLHKDIHTRTDAIAAGATP